jgi:NAD(P)-dependent dehydrogenase (short-subunit alcohol dehydrogenase family)
MPNLLVTGGARGIGRATCTLAASRGWSVAINYVSSEHAALDTVRDVERHGSQALLLPGDVVDETAVVGMFDHAQAELGGLDAVVINAGVVGPSMSLAQMSATRMHRMLMVNTFGALLCAREAARRMSLGSGGSGGAIVFVSSMASKLGSPHEYVDYAASKGAIDTLTIGLAKELGPEGIRVNAVRPGLIDTDIHASGGRPGRAHELGGQTPLGRAGRADEVASAILWLLGPEATYTTGAIIDIAGGR